MNTLALTKELIRCPSITPDDAGCQALLSRRLARLGFQIEALPCGPVKNIWARRGTQAPLVCFAGHTDVVPAGPPEAWLNPPFSPTERDGYLYGRGAADMKASLAAFICAIETFSIDYPHHPGSISLLITSDEEGTAQYGSKYVVETLGHRHEQIDYCLLGEPTSEQRLGDTIKHGRRGSLSGVLTVKGQQGHIAYPHLAKNPIHLLTPALNQLINQEWDPGSQHFEPTNWQISNIHAGVGANNVIPGSIEMHFNFRFSDAQTTQSLQEAFTRILEQHHLDYELSWTLAALPFLSQPGTLTDAISSAITQVLGIQCTLSTRGGTSDGRFIKHIARELIEFGPVNTSIHQVNECIKIADLAALAQVYQKTLEKLLI